MDKEKVRQVAKSIMFNIDDSVLDELTEFFIKHLEELENLKSVNTDAVLPMTRIDNAPISFLREDIDGDSLAKDKLLANAGQTHLGYVAISKKDTHD